MNLIYSLYAILAGLACYTAWLAGTRPPIALPTAIRMLSFLAPGLAFISLALGRAQLLGFAHGQTPWLTRGAFILYGLTLLYIIGAYWQPLLRCLRWPKVVRS